MHLQLLSGTKSGCVRAGLPNTGIPLSSFSFGKKGSARSEKRGKLWILNGQHRAAMMNWSALGSRQAGPGDGDEGRPRLSGARGGPEEAPVDCSGRLGFSPSEKCLCQSPTPRDNSGRPSQARACCPPPRPDHLGPVACPAACVSSGRPSRCPGLLLGGSAGPIPHRAWLCIVAPINNSSLLGAQPRIAGPRSDCLRPTNQPHSRLTFLFLFFSSPCFIFVVLVKSGFLSLLFSSFLFFFCCGAGGGGGGGAWRALGKNVLLFPGAAANSSAWLEQLGTGCKPTPGRSSWLMMLPPRTNVPRSLLSWPRSAGPPGASHSSSGSSVTALGCWLSSWKPPRLNAAPADVTEAHDQSEPRGPSVNHSASPGRGECGETAFRGPVAAASSAARRAAAARRRVPSGSGKMVRFGGVGWDGRTEKAPS